ncbi:MAG: type II secretion system F family protein [Acidobacteria bacterium]|nr:type II secretion system F family protein [Acidobacteriota bacterium]
MEFRCRLGTETGEIEERVCIADSEALLRRDLEKEGLYLLSLRRRGGFAWAGASLGCVKRRPGVREFTVFNQELAALLRAGMPLLQSLDILRQRTDQPVLKTVLDDVHERVRGGSSLSDAFGSHRGLFPGVYTASILAGEKSGNLEETLRRYVSYAKVISGVRRRTLSALIYPAVLLALSGIVVAIIVVRVVPEFTSFYDSMGASLPVATRVLTGVSGFVTEFFWLMALAAAALGGAVWTWSRQPGRGAQLDRLLLRLPFVGDVATRFATSQLARTLATLLGGGIPLVNALDVTARSVGNRHVSRNLDAIAAEVREGVALSTSLDARGIFPPVAVKMVEVGESTGALQDMLNAVADFFDEEIETTLGRFMTLIEPLLLVIMGIVIAGLLLALYWPLLQLGAIV